MLTVSRSSALPLIEARSAGIAPLRDFAGRAPDCYEAGGRSRETSKSGSPGGLAVELCFRALSFHFLFHRANQMSAQRHHRGVDASPPRPP